MLVAEVMGDPMVLAYYSVGQVIALEVEAMVSLFLPQCVVVSASVI